MNNIKSIIDKYEMVKDKRISRLVDFENGTRPFLVCTHWCTCLRTAWNSTPSNDYGLIRSAEKQYCDA